MRNTHRRAVVWAKLMCRSHHLVTEALTLRRNASRRPRVADQPLASSIARSSTAWSIGCVSLPVKVFCWLGWYEPRSV